jgi:putative sporulation protein YtaF
MIFSILLISVSLSLDAFGAGITYGMRKIRIPLLSKFIICFMSVLYSGIALIAGKAVHEILSPGAAGITGAVILAAMGALIIIQTFLKKEEGTKERSCPEKRKLFEIAVKSLGITIQVIRNPDNGDIDRSGVIDTREALLLGFALSVDAIGVGIGSALAGIGSLLIPLTAGIFQMLLLHAGTCIGRRLGESRRLNKKMISVVPGILLITLAIIRIR